MKKLLCIGLALALIFALAACSGTQQPAEDPQEEPVVPADPAEQVKLIAENRDLWLVTDPQQADFMSYAVTDLDENGRLELIATTTEGSGRFSSTQFWEISEDFASLQPVEYLFGETHSEPDIGWNGSFRSYKGELGNFIVAMDEMSNGYAEHYYTQDFFVLRDGVVDAGSISYCMVLSEDSNGDGEPELHAYYYTSGDEEEELTSGAFARSADDFFGYAYDRYVMDLRWKQFDAAARASEVDIPAGLADSWSAFGYRKDMTAFDALFIAPSSYYDELFENGKKAAITYGIESLPDYWMLQEIGTELETRHVSEGGIDCHLIIGNDGLASFCFNDLADARSPIEITGMPVAMAEDSLGDVEEETEIKYPDWMVVFGTDDGLNRFEAYVGPEDGRLYVTWYWWREADPDADPVITYMAFTNGMV